VSRVELLLRDLDRYWRAPRLIDVALDGPRAPSAARILTNLDGADASVLLAGRIPEPFITDGDGIPIGEHAMEVLEGQLGMYDDHRAATSESRAAAAVEDAGVSTEGEETGASEVAPVPSVDASASTAQLQSLSEEIASLREELARAVEAGRAAIAERDEILRERDILRARREDLLSQLHSVKERRRDAETELSSVRDQLADAEARLSVAAEAEFTVDRVDRIARAATSLAARESVSLDDLFVVERLHSAVPEDPRVTQAFGQLLSRLGRHEAAHEQLTSVPIDRLSRTAALALLRSGIALGILPGDIDAILKLVRPSVDDVREFATLTSKLSSGRVLELTDSLFRVVPDEEMSGWLSTVGMRLTGRPLVTLLARWAEVEPDPALRALVVALNDGRLTMNEPGGAALALDLDWLSLDAREARGLADRLLNSLARSRDAAALDRLLQKADHLASDDRHAIGAELIQAIAQIVPERQPITAAVMAGVQYVEDHRQANRLTEAARLAGFVRLNLHRADEETQALAELVLDDLDRALANTAIGQRVAEELEREALGDVKRAVAGKRFLLVGGQRQAWYDGLRRELGFSAESDWRESNRAEPPSMHQLKDIVKAGKLDGVIMFTDFVAHKTSALKSTAEQYGVPYVEAKMSKQGVIDALRTWMRAQGT
jgi:hypothetical protein